jgi:hypothetical protein
VEATTGWVRARNKPTPRKGKKRKADLSRVRGSGEKENRKDEAVDEAEQSREVHNNWLLPYWNLFSMACCTEGRIAILSRGNYRSS